MIPLYGFLEGDTLGLLMLAQPDTKLGALAQQLCAAARLRVDIGRHVRIVIDGVELDPDLSVGEANLVPLQRFDVRRAAGLAPGSGRGASEANP